MMIQHPIASIIIRAKDEQALIGEVLTAIYAQTVGDFEVILVDSGSRDQTLQIAERFPVKTITIRPEQFTYGRALNIGCAAAQGEFLVFVSAHAVPLSTDWLMFLLSHFDDPNVAAVWGKDTNTKTVLPKERIMRQDFGMFMSNCYRGFSNSNAAIRADVWRRHRFNEVLPFTEDKEWAWRVLKDGYTLVQDTRAVVWHYHQHTLRQVWHRSHLEHLGFASFLEFPIPSRYEVVRRICRQAFQQMWHGEGWKQRIGAFTVGLPSQIAREIGRYTGLRQGNLHVRSAPAKT